MVLKTLTTDSSSCGDFYEAFFYACALRSYDAYAFFHTAYCVFLHLPPTVGGPGWFLKMISSIDKPSQWIVL